MTVCRHIDIVDDAENIQKQDKEQERCTEFFPHRFQRKLAKNPKDDQKQSCNGNDETIAALRIRGEKGRAAEQDPCNDEQYRDDSPFTGNSAESVFNRIGDIAINAPIFFVSIYLTPFQGKTPLFLQRSVSEMPENLHPTNSESAKCGTCAII